MSTRERIISICRRVRAAGAVLIVLFLLCSVTSCSSKVTKENYDRLKIGMEYSEVRDILGEPEECNAVLSIRDCTWGGGIKSINVKMLGDEVIFVSSKGL
jgi:hypothetical protein